MEKTRNEMKIGSAFVIGEKGLVEERLRKGFDDFPHWNKRLILQEKFDGWYAPVTKENGITTWDYGWKQYGLLVDFLKHLHDFMPDESVVTGEMGNGTQASLEWAKAHGHPRMVLFDTPKFRGKDIGHFSAELRFNIIREYWEGSGYCVPDSRIQVAESIILPGNDAEINKEIAWKYFNTILARNGEGIVLKLASDGYYSGRNPNIWKVKKYVTRDYVVMGFSTAVAPTHLAKGFKVGSMSLGLYVDGELRAVTSVGSFGDDWRAEFSRNPEKYIGRVAEAGAFDIFKSGALRHGMFIRMRDDRKPEDCVL